MDATRDAVDPTGMADAEELLDRFLADRKDRTLQAYTTDIEDFARFLDRTPAAALARILAGGAGAGQRVALEYAIDLYQRGRAPATIDRRLSTLRAVVRTALDHGLVDWLLQTPTEVEYSAAPDQAAADSEHYLLPRHRGEIDRLDIQHYAFRAVLRASYVAPVRAPARVLDVGCGTGQWGFDICQQFPDAQVVGFDLVPGKPEQPPRYRWVKGNLLSGLPFGDDRFDLVHQRYLVLGVPVPAWPAVVADLVRVTRPGGWVELAEAPFEVEGAGPATERLFSLTRELSASMGLDANRVVFDSLDGYLRDAGLVAVQRREISLPIGRWGGEIGSLMATDNRAGWTRMCEVLQARSRITAAEARELIQGSYEEAQQGRMSWPAAIAYGRKPFQEARTL